MLLLSNTRRYITGYTLSISLAREMASGYAVPTGSLLHSSFSHSLTAHWSSDNAITAKSLVFPVFVVENDDDKQAITAMPGQYRYGVNTLVKDLAPMVAHGLSSVLLFGVLGVRHIM
jgi:delta-aminolevulinic acid dehydratase/porphobilinogen synthase